MYVMLYVINVDQDKFKQRGGGGGGGQGSDVLVTSDQIHCVLTCLRFPKSG